MKKGLIILGILAVFFITFLPLYERHTICGVNIGGGCWKQGMNLIHYLKYKLDYRVKSEQIKTQKIIILTIENQPDVENAGIVVRTVDGKFISRSDLSRFHNTVNIFLDNGRYIFDEYIGGEMIKSFNVDIQLGENEKTINKTITW